MSKNNISKIKLSSFKTKVFLWLAIISMTIYCVWRALYTLPDKDEYGLLAFIFGLYLLIAEIIAAVEAFGHYKSMNNMVVPKKPEVPLSEYPHVDVLIATHNEDVDLLYKTVNGCKHMRYPDKGKVHIYLCDDNNRPEVKALAQKMGIGYFGLENNKHAKAGNLNNAIAQTNSPYIVTFDADMIPTSEFLLETVPYTFLGKYRESEDGVWEPIPEDEMDEKYKFGFIQTPQSFYNADLFQFNFFSENRIPNEQDYFFREINVSRNRSNAPIYAGSNTLISRAALDEVGGIAVGTITEDFETGINIQGKGYSCYAIDKVVAHGLAPTDFKSLIKQRERWGRGCISSLRHVNILFNKGLTLGGKLSYISAFLYWLTFLRRFIFIISPILFVVFGIPVVICGWKGLLCIWLPSYILYNYALRLSSGNIRTQRWSNIVDTIIFPYLIFPILAELVMIKQTKFHVTSKKRTIKKDTNYALGIPHIIMLAFNIYALFICISDMIVKQNISAIILLYWLLVNGVNLIMAVFFIMGRQSKRINDRFSVEIPVILDTGSYRYSGVTHDISENGMAIIFDEPIYFPEGELVDVTLDTPKYTVTVKSEVTHVKEIKGKKWQYGVMVKDLEDDQKAEYYQIVYDRHHSMANTIGLNVSMIDDLYINIQNRTKKDEVSIRKHPRIEVKEKFETVDGRVVEILDINYKYISISNSEFMGNEFSLLLGENLEMKCRDSMIRKGLYEVVNIVELVKSREFMDLIHKWSKLMEQQ